MLFQEVKRWLLLGGGTLEQVATALGRTVNPTILTRQEFTKRVKNKNAFLTRVLAQPKVWLIGGEHELATE